MPYVESECVAGRTIEIERYYTARYGRRGQEKAPSKNPSREEQRIINNKQAEKKLRRLINANFKGGDFHVVLSYKKDGETPPRGREDLREDARKFLRDLRKEYKKMEIPMKYIHVTEIGAKGARHHHLVLNHSDPEAIRRCWPHGFIRVSPLDDSGDYKKLAAYLIKYTCQVVGTEFEIHGKRWNASRNLIHPVPKVKVITNRDWFRMQAQVPHKYKDKYELDKSSIEGGTISTEYGGYGFFRFTLILRC